ncbi:MAG: tetratricopeptide repeat protein [Parvularculaceae bacterium]|nr:tetratricopeptide repeat protein [Parvularculaceae bacterium]
MTVFWLVVLSVSLCAIIIIGYPLLRPRAKSQALREPAESEALPANGADGGTRAPRISRAGRIAAFAAIGVAPLAAVLIYLQIGAPQALNAARLSQSPTSAGAVEKAIATLEAKAEASPGDFGVWMDLGDAYAAANRPANAATAYGRAVEIDGANAAALSALGEALVVKSGGVVTMEAREAFSHTLKIEPEDPRARYFLAEERFQVGAIDEAAKAWAALLNDAPAGAPWFDAVAARLRDAAAQAQIAVSDLGLDERATSRLEASASGAAQGVGAPNSEQMAAIAALPDSERRQMIENMVDQLSARLKSDPDNPEGLRMLARSYRVLGRADESVETWRKFVQRYDAGWEDWREYAFALIESRPQDELSVSTELENTLEKIRSFEADDPLALYYLGFAARGRGDKAAAVTLWTRLEETLPADAPIASSLRALIEETR